MIASNNLSTDPIEALRELTQGEVELDRLRRECIHAAREAGESWERIGSALGISRQAAWEYYNRALREALRRNAESNSALSEADAMNLAVAEARTVRRRRARD